MAEPASSGRHRGAAGPVHVADPDDPRLADYRELKDPARRRREAERQIFVVEGRIAVGELVRSAYTVASLLIEERQASTAAALVEAVAGTGAPVLVASREVVTRTVGYDLHRGVVAIARRPPAAAAEDVVALAGEGARALGRQPAVAVLEGLNDHENLGGVFRNAAAFGIGGVLLDPTCADPLYRRSVRVSLGHVLAVPFARLPSFPAGLTALRAAGYVLAALTPDHGDAAPAATRTALRAFAGRLAGARGVAVLLGAEGPGLSEGVLEAADEHVAIPMTPGVDSLNVATAAAIAFYELAAALGGPGRPTRTGSAG